MKRSTLLFILLLNGLFVVYGLAVTLWTLNEWFQDERLNALFGGFLGGLLFLMAWKVARRWIRSVYRLDEPRF